VSAEDTTTRTVPSGGLPRKAQKAPRKPQDHRPPGKSNPQKGEAWDTPHTFTWDGEEWTVVPSDSTSLEFLAALEDEQMVTALRALLGREQADRFVHGRKLEDMMEFFEVLGEELKGGNL
jgi:hypothetical protein